ncbi:glycoside hydrolase family 16 protein [Methylobacterium trifolii]|uniref:glycoside hydrolase family 16 protein n=1 Tax=Methylobacterium trifolii TaxID=1003092 RepID=UPI001EE003BC|nr:glycoside hydrolase family 16 protein [Methylobacterium trifolii]
MTADSLRAVAFLSVLMAAGVVPIAPSRGEAPIIGAELDLSAWTRTFTDDFDTLDISARGPGTRWTAHVPWGGDFGDARFTDPVAGFPFTVSGGTLRIEARKVAGIWRSGLIASVDSKGIGFAQRYGYFEIRARMPSGTGVWPAFWLVGLDRSTTTAEIDVLEYYGAYPDQFKSVAHVWNRQDARSSYSSANRHAAPGATERFNTFGADVEEEWITFYFNRRAVWRTPTKPEHRQPLYVMANLALGGGFPITDTPDPSVLLIDYIHVYAR